MAAIASGDRADGRVAQSRRAGIGRALAWIRAVIADRGDHAPVPIAFEADDGDGYRLRVDVAGERGQPAPARIAVHPRPNPAPHPIVKEIHACEVDGVRLEADSAAALHAKVARLVQVIAPARVLPLGYLRAPAADYELPIYPVGGGLSVPVIGGPRLRATDFAGIRAAVARFFLTAGYVQGEDDVELSLVRPTDLRRVSPAAIVRSWRDAGVWQPVLDDADGVRLVESAGPASPDVVALLTALRAAPPPGVDGDALCLTAVSRQAWRATAPRTRDAGLALTAAPVDTHEPLLRLPVRRTAGGQLCVAVADARIHVFAGPDAEQLAVAVGRHLAREEFVAAPADVHVTGGA